MNHTANPMPLLQTEALSVTFRTPQGSIHAVREATLELGRGEILGLVGESGCGKSTVAFAVMGYLPASAEVGGAVRFEGRNIKDLSASELQRLRGRRISMVYQDPLTALNPTMPIGRQIEEVVRTHLKLGGQEARQRVTELLESVHLPEPHLLGQRYPHQLSGGMQQRVLIAMALACGPDLLLLDEPTTGLDVTTEAAILDLVVELKGRVNAGVLYISHNLGVIARVADRIAVMYAGQVVEQGPTRDAFKRPRHPYTVGLLNCVPKPPVGDYEPTRLPHIPGSVYDARSETPEACLFAGRCPMVQESCRAAAPPVFALDLGRESRCFYHADVTPELWGLSELRAVPEENRAAPVLKVKNVRNFYGKGQRKLPFLPRFGLPPVRALVDVNFDVPSGKTVGVVGESGSGKTTLARNIAGLVPRTGGEIELLGSSLASIVEKRTSVQRAAVRMIFQNPVSSLNPKLPIRHPLMRSLRKFAGLGRRESRQRAAELLQSVGMDPMYLGRLPSELSGGQQQRVALAVALAASPALVVADEAVSALDVSVQAQVLNLLLEHQREAGTSYVFITHDLGVVRYISDEIVVLYAGHVAETGKVEHLMSPPYHPYTEALLSAVPLPDPEARPSRIRLQGQVPSLRQEFKGCFFASRCPRKIGAICDEAPPPGRKDPRREDNVIYCHIPLEELTALQSDGNRTGEQHPRLGA